MSEVFVSAVQAQIDEQNKQLAAMNVTLTQIQAGQAESLALQKMQAKLQVETLIAPPG